MPDAQARALLDAVTGHEAWAVVRLQDSASVTLLGGRTRTYERLDQIPLEQGPPAPGRRFDRLALVPFRQVAERGFAAHDDGTPLQVLEVAREHEVPLADLLAALPDVAVEFAGPGGFASDDEEYAATVRRIIDEEIGQGEGANLVIARPYRARASGWGDDQALTVLRRLLERERGAYWTFCISTGERHLVGASPERHVTARGADRGSAEVRMNPISGTFRVAEPGAGTAGPDVHRRLLDFLADEKEIYELFMVVDEELKMMCDVCHEGGQVLGPFLKAMTHLVHTEYLLAGRSRRDVREILRDTMFAATVTGSPVENACRLIHRYEDQGRGYYSGAAALLGRDADGHPTLDSPILIRTADVRPDGEVRVMAGATLVRDSDPASEVAETRTKAGGVLSAFGLVPPAPPPDRDLTALGRDEDVLLALHARNARLSPFWLTDQQGTAPAPGLAGRRVVILDAEDDFCTMLRHQLGVMGLASTVVRHDAYAPGALDGADLVVVGPGPGDPRDGQDPKIATLRTAVADVLDAGTPLLAVCLGHQVLCHRLGLGLGFKDIVFQGTQSPVELDGRTERVGFYNTFVARTGAAGLPAGVTAESDPATGDVHLLRGPGYRGIQFHAESILTEHGYDLLRSLVQELLPAAPAPGPGDAGFPG